MATALLGLAAGMLTGAPTWFVLPLIYLTVASAVGADMSVPKPGPFINRFARLGVMTYSIYMWHMMFIIVILNGVGDKFLHLPTLPMLGLAMACYALILAFSYFSFVFIETPARRWIDSYGRKLVTA
jgi:peptidoglycan/LPS O-acetylase OafA/YrhL